MTLFVLFIRPDYGSFSLLSFTAASPCRLQYWFVRVRTRGGYRKRLQGKFSTDTLFPKVMSVHQHNKAQLYSHKCGFAEVYPLRAATRDQIGQSLRDFIADYGAPEHLKFDNHASRLNPVDLQTKLQPLIDSVAMALTLLTCFTDNTYYRSLFDSIQVKRVLSVSITRHTESRPKERKL